MLQQWQYKVQNKQQAQNNLRTTMAVIIYTNIQYHWGKSAIHNPGNRNGVFFIVNDSNTIVMYIHAKNGVAIRRAV